LAATSHKAVKKSIAIYYNQLKNVQLTIGGNDLIKMGIKPGPIFRRILQSVLEAKLDGNVQSYPDELDYARKLIHKRTSQKFLDSGQASQ
jgi:tRNA nucleotidyltransferase (CCA-adding enzyme)